MDFLLSPIGLKSFLILLEPICEMNTQRPSFAIKRHFSNPQQGGKPLGSFFNDSGVFVYAEKIFIYEFCFAIRTRAEKIDLIFAIAQSCSRDL